MIFSVFALGCSQMRHAGRYQEVRVESQPEGAAVLIEGNIEAAPMAVKVGEGLQMVYAAPLQIKTPVTLILDKDCQYRVRVTSEGYPEYEKELVPHFAFHPYLIITFPVVPFWSNYEIKRFDDIVVDFEAYSAELEAKKRAEEEAAAEQEAAEEEAAEEEQPGEGDKEDAPQEKQPEKGN